MRDLQSSNNTHAVIPSCVWLAAAVFQWAAHWLDGMDGKQARRTGSSTPLGELMVINNNEFIITI